MPVIFIWLVFFFCNWFLTVCFQIFYTAADITLAYVAGLVLSMAFEAPILGLEKIIFGRSKVSFFGL